MPQEAVSIMEEASMVLRNWYSNSTVAADMLYRVFKEKFIEGESVKVFGTKWLAILDRFSFCWNYYSRRIRDH